MNWVEIIACVFGVVGIILGTTFALKWQQAVTLLKELGDAFTITSEALKDKELTKEEAISLLKEWKEVFTAVMVLIKR